MPDVMTETLVREADILADCYEDIHSLLRYFLLRAKDVDPYRVFECNGNQLNSLYWLTAHITWSEHFLLIEAMDGEPLVIEWLDLFQIGSTPPATEGLPTFDEVKETLETVHKHAMKTVRALTSEDLDRPNPLDISFKGSNAKRVVLHHAIRHEPYHIGQIGSLIKLSGFETF